MEELNEPPWTKTSSNIDHGVICYPMALVIARVPLKEFEDGRASLNVELQLTKQSLQKLMTIVRRRSFFLRSILKLIALIIIMIENVTFFIL